MGYLQIMELFQYYSKTMIIAGISCGQAEGRSRVGTVESEGFKGIRSGKSSKPGGRGNSDLEFSLYFQTAGEKGSKMEISMDKLTFSWVLFKQFHVIKGVFKAKYSLNSISIWIQGIGND